MREQQDSKLIDFHEKSIICEKHGEIKARCLIFNGKESKGICSLCLSEREKTRSKIQQEIEIKAEIERKRRCIENSLQNAMIPLRFQNHSFETFVEKTEEHAKRKNRCFDYAKNFPENLKKGISMIFCGTTGTGKTHLACSIANHVIYEHGKTAVFLSVMDAVRRIKETYRKTSKENEREAISSLVYPDLLILDEVGVQFGTDTEKMILFEIINKRYENMKPTILLSNLSPEILMQFVGERIMDRMKEGGGKLLIFSFESHR